MIIDFTEDKNLKIKNFICPGGFYVALTRVKHGSKVFLKGFDRSYICTDRNLKEKVNSFRKFNSYEVKKVYLNEEIFKSPEKEIKMGYLNINGFFNGGHGEYLNADKNLSALDLLVIAESHLTPKIGDRDIENVISNWKLVARYDGDNQEHIGLLLVVPKDKEGTIVPYIESISEFLLQDATEVRIHGLKVKFEQGMELGFVYCRKTPTFEQVRDLKTEYKKSDFLLGDFNLSRHKIGDTEKLDDLCGKDSYHGLCEITRVLSSNQLDYIVVKKIYRDTTYCTSFLNFCSDHKAIVCRTAFDTEFLPKFRQKVTFSTGKLVQRSVGNVGQDENVMSPIKDPKEGNEVNIPGLTDEYHAPSRLRKFRNPDMTYCWLNSCLQLVLNAMEHYQFHYEFNSSLGLELDRLFHSDRELNPTNVRDIIMEEERERRRRNPLAQYLNLENGQQCCRDFFLALKENLTAWPEVFALFCFQIMEETRCPNCKRVTSTNDDSEPRMYLEMEVPGNGSDLSYVVETELHSSQDVESYHCESRNGGCGMRLTARHRNMIKSMTDKQFIIVLLRRVIETNDGYEINRNNVRATGDIQITDKVGSTSTFCPIAVIDHTGSMQSQGQTQGHYMCDVKTRENKWFHTSDNMTPKEITERQVTKQAAVVLYSKQI